MSCRRVCRELLSFVRFGELGPRSQPHLDHLAGCASCRDEIGYDREMVQRLRMALAARIDGMGPSPQVWEHILRRAQAPDPEPEGWLGRLGAAAVRRRTTTAMAGTALALVLALNMEVVSIMPAGPSDASMEATITDADGADSQRWARPSALRPATPTVEDAVGPRTVVISQPEVRMTGIVAGLTPPSAAAAPPDPTPEVRVVFGPVEPVGPLADDDRLDMGSPAQEEPEAESKPGPAGSPAPVAPS